MDEPCAGCKSLMDGGSSVTHRMKWNRLARIPRCARPVIAILLAAAVAAQPVPAQGSIRGRVIDSELGDPLSGAVIRIRGRPTLTTDTLGRFAALGVSPGETDLRIELIGFTPGTFKVRMPASGDLERDFALDFTGHRLPDVVVRARAERLMSRYVDFENRRSRGMGAYFRWDELKNSGYNSVGDALRTVRGVRIRCNQQTYECFAMMVRSPGCPPTWFIDGTEVASFHENTSIRDIYGIEVYRGPGEVPGEFTGSNAACGVIVMWTKSKPFR